MLVANERAAISGHISREVCDEIVWIRRLRRCVLEIDVIQSDRGFVAGRDNGQTLAITPTDRCASRIHNGDGVLGVVVSVSGLAPKGCLSLARDQDVLNVRTALDEDGVAVAVTGKSLKGSRHSPVLAFGRIW